jgi:hypothetical protein
MLDILPVAGTNIAWSSYIKFFLDHTGDNIAKKVDGSGLKLSDYEKFIKTFDNNAALKHLNFSFLILLPIKLFVEICENTNLNITSYKALQRNHRVIFITGSLEEWSLALPKINSELSSILLSFFNQIGLKNHFKEIKRIK